MYICVTHVDSDTKIPCFQESMKRGPSFPCVKGLTIVWSDESDWPIENINDYPKFYGICDDDADTTVPGVVSVLTEQEYTDLYQTELSKKQVYKELYVPPTVSPKQARLALLKANVLSQVVTAFEQLDEPLKSVVMIEWEFSNKISRVSPLISVVQDILQWDNNTINNLFISANQITANDFLPKAED